MGIGPATTWNRLMRPQTTLLCINYVTNDFPKSEFFLVYKISLKELQMNKTFRIGFKLVGAAPKGSSGLELQTTNRDSNRQVLN